MRVQVEAGMKVVVQSLTQLFSDCASISQAPGKRREMDKASQVLGALFWSLNEGYAGHAPTHEQPCLLHFQRQVNDSSGPSGKGLRVVLNPCTALSFSPPETSMTLLVP